MNKKMWGISLAAVLALGLTACSGSQETAEKQPEDEISAEQQKHSHPRRQRKQQKRQRRRRKRRPKQPAKLMTVV